MAGAQSACLSYFSLCDSSRVAFTVAMRPACCCYTDAGCTCCPCWVLLFQWLGFVIKGNSWPIRHYSVIARAACAVLCCLRPAHRQRKKRKIKLIEWQCFHNCFIMIWQVALLKNWIGIFNCSWFILVCETKCMFNIWFKLKYYWYSKYNVNKKHIVFIIK